MADEFEFSTERLSPKERFDTWRQFAMEQAGIDVEQMASDGASAFRGAFRAQLKGPLLRFSTQSDATRVSRGRREFGRRPKGCYFIYRERSSGAQYDFDGREFTTRRGSLIVGDLDQPFVTQPEPGARFHHSLLYLPKALLEPYLPKKIGPFARPLSEGAGLDGLAGSAVRALWREWSEIPEAAMPMAADALCRLIGLAFGADARDHGEAVRGGRLAQARRFIDSHLTDPGLSATRTAAALRISERTLYALFETGGTTFAAHVRRRRLEECRAALLANFSRPVMDVALSWGFGSMPSFYRAFQATYGLSPSDLREAASAGLSEP